MKIQTKWVANLIEAFACLIVILSLGILASPFISKADDTVPYIPYGGFVTSYVQPTLSCPLGYSLVTNANSDPLSGLPEFGITMLPINPPITYDDGSQFLAVPSTPLLGGYLLPDVGCSDVSLGAIQVFDLYYNLPDAPLYLTGEGGLPK